MNISRRRSKFFCSGGSMTVDFSNSALVERRYSLLDALAHQSAGGKLAPCSSPEGWSSGLWLRS